MNFSIKNPCINNRVIVKKNARIKDVESEILFFDERLSMIEFSLANSNS